MPNNNKQGNEGRRDAPSTGQQGGYRDTSQSAGGSQQKGGQSDQRSGQSGQQSQTGGSQQKSNRSGMNDDDET